MGGESRRWAQAGGVGGLLFVVSLWFVILWGLLTNPIPEPAFDASSQAVLTYEKASQEASVALVGILGLFCFLVFAVSLAARVREASDRSITPWILVIATAVVFVVTWLAAFALMVGGDFRQRDLDAVGASILWGASQGLFVVSWCAVGGFLVAAGAAALWSHGLPSWLGWWALVIGAGMFISSAVPLTSIWFYPYVLFFAWVIAASVVLLAQAPRSRRAE